MKETIVYDSLSGNTKELAETIKKIKKEVSISKISDKLIEESKNSDVYYIGSPIIKGMCTEKIRKFLQGLQHKRIFLFVTAGYGGSKEYYETLEKRIRDIIPKSNEIIGTFFCQGKMSESIKNRYVELMKEHPEDKKLKVSLENYEKAKNHPNEEDKQNLIEEIKKINLT